MNKIYTYSLSHTVLYSEIDARGLLSLPSFFSLFQEAAVLHADALDFGTEYCKREGLMWVISRLLLDIQSFPEHRSQIKVVTWPKAPKGPFASRDFVVKTEDGEKLAVATSSWLLLDTKNMRPVRPQKLFAGYPFEELGEAIEGAAPKIGDKAEECDSELDVVVRYSDLDQNMHVNNTRYVRWFLDCYAPEEVTPKGNLRFSINYLQAASYGDYVKLCRFDGDSHSTVRGFRGGGEETFAAQILSTK